MDTTRRNFLSGTATAAALAAAAPLLAQAPRPAAASATPEAKAPAAAPEHAAPAQAGPSFEVSKDIKKITVINLRELEPDAEKVLSAGSYGYISSAAGDEWTKKENEAAYKRLTIETRALTGYKDADLTTTLLGAKISMPIIVTAMGGHGNAHVTAEAGTAKGADAAGTLFTTPSMSSIPMEDIMKASPGPKWFQLYMPEDRGVARSLVQRAKAAGFLAIVLTIDGAGGSNRETNIRNGFTEWQPSGNFPNGRVPNKNDLSWDDVEFLQKESGLPVFIKGVLSPEIALMAVEQGCAGVQVSNHGGRQLDDVPASITVLPRIVDAVRGRIVVVVDGGVRRGQDVFKALAIGANAVAVGRPVMYGLALGGWMGVQTVLEHIKGELMMTMRHAGVKSIGDVSKKYLWA